MSPQQRLARFLFTYRNTPHTVTERTPAEMFLKRQPRTRLSLLKPDMSEVVLKHQLQQKKAHDKRAKPLRTFKFGRRVGRDFRHSKKLWIPRTILQRRGPLTYVVQVGHRRVMHVDHLRASKASYSPSRRDDNDFLNEYSAGCEDPVKSTEPENVAAGPYQQVQQERRYPERQWTALTRALMSAHWSVGCPPESSLWLFLNFIFTRFLYNCT